MGLGIGLDILVGFFGMWIILVCCNVGVGRILVFFDFCLYLLMFVGVCIVGFVLYIGWLFRFCLMFGWVFGFNGFNGFSLGLWWFD